ncbi:MAG: metallophosphoesterase [Actinobacteria bacterium]|nr:metallophosphoesterase [Actinomycetota bacterium]
MEGVSVFHLSFPSGLAKRRTAPGALPGFCESTPESKGGGLKSRGPDKDIVIAHISDIHVGSNHFVPNLIERVIVEINELEPDAVVVSGDLTNDGFFQQYAAVKAYLDNIQCQHICALPGNHDSRNVGYVHFEDHFGPRNSAIYLPGVTVVALDSSQPDLNEGKLGRHNYHWIVDKLNRPEDFKIVAMHHHLLPLPGTGRERNIIDDAGDFLELLVNQGIDLVLCGHKHVPNIWSFENFHVVNAGTVSSLRVRGYAKQCYNIIEIEPDRCRVSRKYLLGKKKEVASFPILPRP